MSNMFKIKYLIRLDDACPTMDHMKWQQVENILNRYGVCPMAGIIPNNENPHEIIDGANALFWEKVLSWKNKGWTIAMHGYNHCYTSNGGLKGLNPIWERSEFAGLSLEEQRNKIRLGVSIMREHGINPNYFFAPSHTFDENTIVALREESDIRIISDTIGRYPYKKEDFWFIPQIVGHCMKMPIGGIYTFCFHPNIMKEHDFMCLESFLKDYSTSFIAFDDIKLDSYGDKVFVDKLLSFLFFKYRNIRGLR